MPSGIDDISRPDPEAPGLRAAFQRDQRLRNISTRQIGGRRPDHAGDVGAVDHHLERHAGVDRHLELAVADALDAVLEKVPMRVGGQCLGGHVGPAAHVRSAAAVCSLEEPGPVARHIGPHQSQRSNRAFGIFQSAGQAPGIAHAAHDGLAVAP